MKKLFTKKWKRFKTYGCKIKHLMGIPSLFKKMIENHPDLLCCELKRCVDTLYIDFNCLIHDASRNVCVTDEVIKPYDPIVQYTNYETVIQNTIQSLRLIIEKIKPVHVFIAMDGPVPKSKMMKQRERRMRKTNSYDPYSFDSNAITPGTLFMDLLSKRIHSCIHFKSFPCKHIEFSDYKCPGEGEFKIYRKIHDEKITSGMRVVYGMDADLIVLSIASIHYKSIYLCREYENEIQFLGIEKCLDNMKINSMKRHDFVFALMLGGNDFVPCIEFLKIRSNGWELITQAFHDFDLPLTKNTIIWKNVLLFFKRLQLLEIENLRIQHQKIINRRHYPTDNIYDHGFFNDPTHPLHSLYGEQSMKSVVDRNDYYSFIFGNNDESFIQNACNHFVASIQWCWEYYIHGRVLSWDYYYPYVAGPRMEDVCKYLNKSTKLISKTIPNNQHIFTPLEQMLCVLPKTNLFLFPECVRFVLQYEYNPIDDWYVDNNILEPITGQKMIYANSFLPDIDTKHAVMISEICQDMMTKNEAERSALL
tara:strand:+ start:7245 stop:8846 length:1602 start_codon:yes stop_codon:yes gene_type:complete